MQLYALNEENQLVFADHAIKQTNYICLECHGVVRARGGMHRQNHYYHLTPNASCYLSSKSMIHIQAQAHLKKLLPEKECVLEKRFDKIGRIADVVWLPQKLIFEIQCSFISAEEVQNRNRDYASQGFQVIWILHDSRFNQRRITAAESFLRQSPFYFTNIDAKGTGIIYDQFDHFGKGLRSHVMPTLAIDLRLPRFIEAEGEERKEGKEGEETFPLCVEKRLESWPLYFSGDLVDLFLAEGKSSEYIQQILEKEQLLQPKLVDSSHPQLIMQMIRRFVIRPYALLFQMLLEKACK